MSEAFASALLHWPRARHSRQSRSLADGGRQAKAIDAHRARKRGEDIRAARGIAGGGIGHGGKIKEIPDERLELLFACAHPAIDEAVRAPLMLQAVLGFDAATIASAFLVSPAAMGQSLVRAKAKIRESGIPFRVPEREELPERLPPVLDAIYAAYAEGWSDPAGTDPSSRELSAEAIWLGRLVAMLMPGEAEALGLLALMLHSEARRAARRSDAGDSCPCRNRIRRCGTAR